MLLFWVLKHPAKLGSKGFKEKMGGGETEVTSKFTHKVISMFKHFAELTSAIRALARTVSYFMYEL